MRQMRQKRRRPAWGGAAVLPRVSEEDAYRKAFAAAFQRITEEAQRAQPFRKASHRRRTSFSGSSK